MSYSQAIFYCGRCSIRFKADVIENGVACPLCGVHGLIGFVRKIDSGPGAPLQHKGGDR